MIEFDVQNFYAAFSQLRMFYGILVSPGDGKASSKSIGALRDSLNSCRKELDSIGARFTASHILRVKGMLKEGMLLSSLVEPFNECELRLKDELVSMKMLMLEARDISYFEPAEPLFGADFEANFPADGAFELDEAAKCMALGRPTAAVFHLMRLMEIGIRALARCLGIPDPIKPAERNWGKILDRIRDDGLNKKWPASADRLSGDGALFESLHASLDAIKNPWRNATMHVENKYTDDEAEHIFAAVRGFMRKLASRMDENGNPLA